MYKDLAQEAIEAALNCKWDEAVRINALILQKDSSDVDALNRLARAYSELGNIKKAREGCLKVLKVDPFNTIASRSLEKWKGLKSGEIYSSPPSKPDIFLEEPGKTKVVSLLFLGSTKLLAKLDTADELKLDTHSHRVVVETPDKKYVGRLPDDLSARLKKLIKFGNSYSVFVKSIDKNDVKVFVRELRRDKKLKDIASFPAEKIDYISFTPPELVHDKSEIAVESEDEE